MQAHDDDRGGRPLERLTRRGEFLRVGKGRRWHGAAMSLQAAARVPETDGPPRFGFTLTKKVGNAVVRNRARRRLREAVRLAAAGLPAKPGHDYVIVGRIAAVRVPFAALDRELRLGLVAVHERGKARDKRLSPIAQAGTAGHSAPERTRSKP